MRHDRDACESGSGHRPSSRGRARSRARGARSSTHASWPSGGADQLDPISPWVAGVEPTDLRKLLIPHDLEACCGQPHRQRLQPGRIDEQRGMPLAGRDEGLIDPHVELLLAEREPDTTPSRQRPWLRHFAQPEQLTEESSSVGLAARRRRQLDVVEAMNEQA